MRRVSYKAALSLSALGSTIVSYRMGYEWFVFSPEQVEEQHRLGGRYFYLYP